MGQTSVADVKGRKVYTGRETVDVAADPLVAYMNKDQLQMLVLETQRKMEQAAKDMDFLEAARFRDEYLQLKEKLEKQT